MKRTFGHFARILIEIDLTKELRDRIMVEREDFAFYVDLEYERLPQFCSHCHSIGHSIANCKKNIPVEEAVQKKQSLQYVQKKQVDEKKKFQRSSR